MKFKVTINEAFVKGSYVTPKDKKSDIDDEVTYGKSYEVLDTSKIGRTIMIKIKTDYDEETQFNSIYFKKA